jgi:hypothetical protein
MCPQDGEQGGGDTLPAHFVGRNSSRSAMPPKVVRLDGRVGSGDASRFAEESASAGPLTHGDGGVGPQHQRLDALGGSEGFGSLRRSCRTP